MIQERTVFLTCFLNADNSWSVDPYGWAGSLLCTVPYLPCPQTGTCNTIAKLVHMCKLDVFRVCKQSSYIYWTENHKKCYLCCSENFLILCNNKNVSILYHQVIDESHRLQIQCSPKSCLYNIALKSIKTAITLTHWGRDKIAAISKMTFSNVFSWIKMYEFRLRFHCSLVLRFQSIISQHCFR